MCIRDRCSACRRCCCAKYILIRCTVREENLSALTVPAFDFFQIRRWYAAAFPIRIIQRDACLLYTSTGSKIVYISDLSDRFQAFYCFCKGFYTTAGDDYFINTFSICHIKYLLENRSVLVADKIRCAVFFCRFYADRSRSDVYKRQYLFPPSSDPLFPHFQRIFFSSILPHFFYYRYDFSCQL